MIILGIDTSEARGSVAMWREGAVVCLAEHETTGDYSLWLLPAVENCAKQASIELPAVDVFAVATGPGSFTGLRVGITTVKAWAELYGKPVAGVSRLEVMARTIHAQEGFVAASFDAQRGQIFGGLYRVNQRSARTVVEQEMVIDAEEFVRWVGSKAGSAPVHWVTLDPELILRTPAWEARAQRGETLAACRRGLAAGVAQLGEERARRGELSDALRLDANYVRRSDAEIFWKDPVRDGS